MSGKSLKRRFKSAPDLAHPGVDMRESVERVARAVVVVVEDGCEEQEGVRRVSLPSPHLSSPSLSHSASCPPSSSTTMYCRASSISATPDLVEAGEKECSPATISSIHSLALAYRRSRSPPPLRTASTTSITAKLDDEHQDDSSDTCHEDWDDADFVEEGKTAKKKERPTPKPIKPKLPTTASAPPALSKPLTRKRTSQKKKKDEDTPAPAPAQVKRKGSTIEDLFAVQQRKSTTLPSSRPRKYPSEPAPPHPYSTPSRLTASAAAAAASAAPAPPVQIMDWLVDLPPRYFTLLPPPSSAAGTDAGGMTSWAEAGAAGTVRGGERRKGGKGDSISLAAFLGVEECKGESASGGDEVGRTAKERTAVKAAAEVSAAAVTGASVGVDVATSPSSPTATHNKTETSDSLLELSRTSTSEGSTSASIAVHPPLTPPASASDKIPSMATKRFSPDDSRNSHDSISGQKGKGTVGGSAAETLVIDDEDEEGVTEAADAVGGDGEKKVMRCFSCKMEGHFARDCPEGPYYERNFMRMVEGVFSASHHAHLFTAEDRAHVANLSTSISPAARRLYIRLLQRREGWFRMGKLQYAEIADVGEAIAQLVASGLAWSEDKLTHLPDVLDLMLTPELVQLRRLLRIDGAADNKAAHMAAILKYTRGQGTLLAFSSQDVVLRHALRLLGRCVRVVDDIARLWDHVETLYFMRTSLEDPGGLTQMLMASMGKVAYASYDIIVTRPVFESRSHLHQYSEALRVEAAIAAATTRCDSDTAEALLHTCFNEVWPVDAAGVLGEIVGAAEIPTGTSKDGAPSGAAAACVVVEDGNDDCVVELQSSGSISTTAAAPPMTAAAAASTPSNLASKMPAVVIHFVDDDDDVVSNAPAVSKPTFPRSASNSADASNPKSDSSAAAVVSDPSSHSSDLRPEDYGHFHHVNVYTRIMSASVEALERERRYDDACLLLRKLLAQPLLRGSRGRWWDRLALNLGEHLGQPVESFEACMEGLMDGAVSHGRKLDLLFRARRLCEAKNSPFAERLVELPLPGLIPCEKVEVRGVLLPQTDNPGEHGGRVAFVDDDALCSVEDLVVREAARLGWCGVHSEGRIFTTLFGLLFWDIIFSPVPDVFHSPFQSAPLDFGSRRFYARRKEAIDNRLLWLETADIRAAVAKGWDEHHGVLCAGVNWDLLGREDLCDAAHAIGPRALCGVFSALVGGRHVHGSGMPDVVVWPKGGGEAGCARVLEVKSPNDRLSSRQMVWIHLLRCLGLRVGVCNVRTHGARFARLNTANGAARGRDAAQPLDRMDCD